MSSSNNREFEPKWRSSSAIRGFAQSCKRNCGLECRIGIRDTLRLLRHVCACLERVLPVFQPSPSEIFVSLIDDKFQITILQLLRYHNRHHQTTVPSTHTHHPQRSPRTNRLFSNNIARVGRFKTFWGIGVGRCIDAEMVNIWLAIDFETRRHS